MPRWSIYGQYQLITYNRVAEFFLDIYGLKLSEATIYNAFKTVYDTLEPAENIIMERLLNSEVLNVNEIGMRVESKRQWLHVASTDTLTHYKWYRYFMYCRKHGYYHHSGE